MDKKDAIGDTIPRRTALKALGLVALGGAAAATGVYLGNKIAHDEKSLARLSPDISIPESTLQEIGEINQNLTNLTNKIRDSEGGDVPDIDSNSIYVLNLTQGLFRRKIGREFNLINPDDFKTWILGEKGYQYKYEAEKPQVTGGSEQKRDQAAHILNAYLKEDQFRVASLTLTNRNNAGFNVVEWEAGSDFYLKGKENYPWDIYTRLIHELTHAGSPLNFVKGNDDKKVLLPYGLPRTVEFIKMWTDAFTQEYDYFRTRFFAAEGDQTLALIRKGGIGFGSALSEMVAMLTADYVFPTFDTAMQVLQGYNEPLDKFPLTETAIRKTIAFVNAGVNGLDVFPDGVPKRSVYFKGSLLGDLFWTIYNFAIEDVQKPKP